MLRGGAQGSRTVARRWSAPRPLPVAWRPLAPRPESHAGPWKPGRDRASRAVDRGSCALARSLAGPGRHVASCSFKLHLISGLRVGSACAERAPDALLVYFRMTRRAGSHFPPCAHWRAAHWSANGPLLGCSETVRARATSSCQAHRQPKIQRSEDPGSGQVESHRRTPSQKRHTSAWPRRSPL